MNYNRKIILENKEEYLGFGFGADCNKVCEIVFNTSMVGYQEILSDPSYTYQAVVMTYPLIGNYGMAEEDYETETPTIGAFIVREYNDEPSNFRSKKSLDQVMKEYDIPGIYGVDTRKINRRIRDLGSMKVLITTPDTSLEEGMKILKETEVPRDAVSKVSRKSMAFYPAQNDAGSKYTKNYHVVAIDCGMKQNIVRSMNRRGINVTVVPWNTKPEQISPLHPDGIFISNGPGDPTDVPEVIETVSALKGKVPVFGICLGHQILSLAYGAKTYKLKFGHRGGNHPVKNLKTNRLEITSQNHSYAVDDASVEGTDLTVTHINLLDNTVEGVECKKDFAFSVQYHPESAPGPQDSAYLFEEFLTNMEEFRNSKS
ncbi:MAG: glutamine-hydrolyzing carbamoyl-phosphate synthase small subunit [Lachnospiraceae bacterium]|nr:glutamine-hydrolyzing carbamoyl-phosphate synthase small subunit [Lachnospiraceae bacterium]